MLKRAWLVFSVVNAAVWLISFLAYLPKNPVAVLPMLVASMGWPLVVGPAILLTLRYIWRGRLTPYDSFSRNKVIFWRS